MRLKRMYVLLILMLALIVGGCGAPNIDPMAMQVTTADSQQVVVPDVCMPQYVSKVRTVAVVPFINNTTFGKMKAVSTNETGQSTKTRKHVEGGAIGAVATPGAVGIGYVGASKTTTKKNWSKDVNTFYRQISSKLGEFAQSAVEDAVSKMGGVELYTRAQMAAIVQEQNFQMNVADPNTMIEFGRIAGVEYIITGTVDNINAKYVSKNNLKSNTGNVWVDLAVGLGSAAANTQAGWNITTQMTVQVIDVSTGKIILSKKVKGRELGGTQRGFNPELVVTAAKVAMGESMADIRPETSGLFDAKTYINQLRGSKQVALIGMGKDKKLEPGQEIEAYEFLEIVDFMSKQKMCTKSKIPLKLTVSNQVDEISSWIKVEGDASSIARLKIGTLVRRAPLGGQSFMKKMF